MLQSVRRSIGENAKSEKAVQNTTSTLHAMERIARHINTYPTQTVVINQGGLDRLSYGVFDESTGRKSLCRQGRGRPDRAHPDPDRWRQFRHPLFYLAKYDPPLVVKTASRT